MGVANDIWLALKATQWNETHIWNVNDDKNPMQVVGP